MISTSDFPFSSPFATDAFRVKVGLAEMLKGGVIMDVVDADQAKIAEDAGAVAVMALERVPSDIRRDGGVARMSPVSKIREIEAAVSIPVMAKCRIGHLAEARVLEALEIAGAAARDLARQAARRQKTPARETKDAAEAALIQI